MFFNKEELLLDFEKLSRPKTIKTNVKCRYNNLCSGTYLHIPNENKWICSKAPNHNVHFHTDGYIAFTISDGATYTCYKTFQDWADNKQIFEPVNF